MNNEHNSRPCECSTKYLEKLEEGPEFPDKGEFMKELSKRRGSKRNLKALRASKREAYLEYVKEKTAKQNEFSGDVRKMYGGKKK